MLDIDRCQHVSRIGMSAVVAITCGACEDLPGEDVSGLHDLPPIFWRGRFMEFGTDVDARICRQTLPSMDEYIGGIAEAIRSNTEYPSRYFYLDASPRDYGFGCPEDYLGCVRNDGDRTIVGSVLLNHKHELIHASSSARQHTLLEEGLAVYLGTDLQWAGIAEPDDIQLAFDSIEGSHERLPPDFYPVAGHFVAYLAETHGLPAVVSLVEASAPGMTLDELSELSTEHLSQDLRLELDAYEAAGPGCEVAQFSPMWFECELTPPSIPIFTCGTEPGGITVDVTVACDGAASGVEDGWIWQDVLIDAEGPELALIALKEGHPVDFVVRSCGQGCTTPFARISSAAETNSEGVILQAFEVRVGLNLVRIAKPIEAEGRVRFSIGGVCP